MEPDIQSVTLEELYILLHELEGYDLYAVIYSSDGFEDWCMAPARFIFQLFGDQTIFFVVPNDLHLEFDFLDWLDWLHNEAYRCSAAYNRVKWHQFMTWMRNEHTTWLNIEEHKLFAVPGDVTTQPWVLYRNFVSTELQIEYPVVVPWQ